MEVPPDTVLIFDRDEDLLVFESFVHATNWIEAIDVDEGEYTAGYTPDGGVLTLAAPEGPEGPVVLTRTGSVDLGDLEQESGPLLAPPPGRSALARTAADSAVLD